MSTAACIVCKASFEIPLFLSGSSGYATSTDSGVAPCPSCGQQIEFRVRASTLELGYSYWAGSFHFEGLVSFPVSGLRQRRSGSTVTIELHGRALGGGGSSES